MNLMRFEKFSTVCESSEDILYKKVNSSEFMEKKRLYNMCNFTSKERSEITKILKERGERMNRDIRWSFSSDYVDIYTGSNEVEICKLDDHWFTVVVQDKWYHRDFYVCDGDEAVYSFLKKEWF